MNVGIIHGRALASTSVRGLVALLAAVALAAFPGFATPALAAARQAKTPRAYALVDVTVASLWARPSDPRPVDAPSLRNPVHLGAWLGALSTPQRVWLTGHLIDQDLYGQRVAIWKRRGDWDKISLTGRATRTGLSYPGWVPVRQLTTPMPATAGSSPASPVGPEALVAVPKAWLYGETSSGQRGRRLLRLSFNTRLPELGQSGAWTIVQTPEGRRALIPSSATRRLRRRLRPVSSW